jgi:glyoxylase-like metal-dependent hydrolase (beta-lactamase superfamily II)
LVEADCVGSASGGGASRLHHPLPRCRHRGFRAIIDIGQQEIIIDGGNSPSILMEYIRERDIVDGAIELVVVTHGDTDHWKGLNRLMGFDGHNPSPPQVLEFWEPGYGRDCNGPTSTARQSYLSFIDGFRQLPGITFKRPLEDSHQPAVQSGTVQPFTLPSVPNVTFTVLHSEEAPTATNGECSYLINNASIVLMVEIAGSRFLFTGDANGKERDEPGPGTPGHIELQLLNF